MISDIIQVIKSPPFEWKSQCSEALIADIICKKAEGEEAEMYYIFEQVPLIKIPAGVDSEILETFLQNYTYGRKWKILVGEEQNAITIGNAVKADLESAEYVIQATESGVYVGGRDASSLMRGFLAFLERIRYLEEEDSFAMDTCCILGSPRMMFRCVHLCVFPET